MQWHGREVRATVVITGRNAFCRLLGWPTASIVEMNCEVGCLNHAAVLLRGAEAQRKASGRTSLDYYMFLNLPP